MANNLSSNITRKVMKAFIPAFEKQRVLSKTVNTQMFQGKFNPASGEYVDIKRPHQYNAIRTAAGDISTTRSSIIAGKATAQVQNYITVAIDWTNKEEALHLDQLEAILKPAAETCIIELETSLNTYMINNAALFSGVVGTVVDAWADVASPMSLMKSIGIPEGMHYFVMNPFTIQNLAGTQTGLSADPARLVQTAWENAQISTPFAGMRAIASNNLATYASSASADRIGALTATPTITYVGAKDTMQQVWAVTGFTANTTLKAGDVLQLASRYIVNRRTGNLVLNASGNRILHTATVIADTLLGSSGEGNVTVSGAAIYESGGQYNNVATAPASGDHVTVLGAASAVHQPNLFYHKDAFAIAFVKLSKLYSTDTVAVTSDGIAIRCSKYSDGSANTQTIRFDLLPAFGVLNPFFAGKAWGY